MRTKEIIKKKNYSIIKEHEKKKTKSEKKEKSHHIALRRNKRNNLTGIHRYRLKSKKAKKKIKSKELVMKTATEEKRVIFRLYSTFDVVMINALPAGRVFTKYHSRSQH